MCPKPTTSQFSPLYIQPKCHREKRESHKGHRGWVMPPEFLWPQHWTQSLLQTDAQK